jgi:hypothetical protein
MFFYGVFELPLAGNTDTRPMGKTGALKSTNSTRVQQRGMGNAHPELWVFLGKGSSKIRRKKMSTFPKKSPGNYFFGGFFFRVDFILISTFLLRWLSASRQGELKNTKTKLHTGSGSCSLKKIPLSGVSR